MRTSRRILSGHRLEEIDCQVVGKFGEGKIEGYKVDFELSLWWRIRI